MTKIKSIFGAYADKLQLIVDSRNDKSANFFYPKYFDWGTPQISLSYVDVIGKSRLEAAASVKNRESETPLRSNGELSKLQGEIPAIGEMFKMTEVDYRNFLTLQSMITVSPETKKNQILDMIYGHVSKAANSTHKRLDIMALEALSTGKISLTTTNNPDGIVLTDSVDLLMPSENKKNTTASWGTPVSAKPITDIQNIVLEAWRTKGLRFEKVLMSNALFFKFVAAKEVVDTLATFYYGPKASGFNPVAVSTLANINGFLEASRLPIIEIVDEVIGIEKDGKITPYTPFAEDTASFIPFGKLGVIQNAIAIEELTPVSSVSYAKYDHVLISKWSQNEPLAEFTKSELNAVPASSAIDSIFLLKAVL